MTQYTNEIFLKLSNIGNKSPKTNRIWLIIAIIALSVMVISAILNIFSLMMICGYTFGISVIVLLIKLASCASNNSSLKASLSIIECTGSIKYINEILNNNYQLQEKNIISEHIYFIPGTFVLAFDDIIDIRRFKGDYVFVTITGKQVRVSGMKVNKQTIEYMFNNYDITNNASYNTYKHKIENFTNGIMK